MLVLIGASASGKTEIAKILIAKYKFKKMITYTTREIRDGEVDGVDYHFITKERFLHKKDHNEFLETAVYNNTYYGSPTEDADFYKVIIVEPKGANNIYKKNIPNIIFIFLKTDELIRRVRMLNRGDNPTNVESRLKEDQKHFQISKFKHLDYVVNTSKNTLEELADKINNIYLSHLSIALISKK